MIDIATAQSYRTETCADCRALGTLCSEHRGLLLSDPWKLAQ